MDPQLVNIPNLSAETIKQVTALLAGADRAVTKDITTATGLVATNLEPLARLLQPINTPFRNRIPRVKNTKGGTAVQWKQITSLDLTTTRAATQEGHRGLQIAYSVTPRTASFFTTSAQDNVSFDAQEAGLTFEDVKSASILRLLKNVMIIEHQMLWGDRLTDLTVGTVTCVGANSGGTLADGTYLGYCRPITNLGRGKSSAQFTTGALSGGTINSFTATIPWCEGASAYEWYFNDGNGGVVYTKHATTSINSLAVTAPLTVGAVKPADNAVDTYGQDAYIAQATAANGVVIKTLATGTAGVGTDVTLEDFYGLLSDMWDAGQADPKVAYLNAQQHRRLSALWLAANGGPTQFVSSGPSQSGITGGYFMRSIMNPITGSQVELITDPYLMAGQIMVVSDAMPPGIGGSDVPAPLQVETSADYQQIDYAIVNPKWEFEVRIREAIKLYFPMGMGIIRNCSTKVTA